MAQAHELSQDAYDRLAAELEELTTVGRIEIARKIETARELGDLSENGDYQAAKEEQGKMEGRIMRLTGLITDAVIVEKAAGGVVGIGSVVTIRYEGDTDTERYLLGSIEERREGVEVISPGSPLGQELLGSKVGDKVSFASPSGAMIAVEVVEVGD